MYNNIAIILAGGCGTRLKNSNIPKQYIAVSGKPVIVHTLEAFQRHAEIDAIAVVCGEGYIDHMLRLKSDFGLDKVKSVIRGGDTRQESSYKGLDSLRGIAYSDSIAIIHDAARPLVSQSTISGNITYAKAYGGATTAVSSADTMLRSYNTVTAAEILHRDGLYCVQTPQSFIFSNILKAHEAALKDNALDFTDDGGLYMKYINTSLSIVKGSSLNFKITTDEDLKLFQAALAVYYTFAK